MKLMFQIILAALMPLGLYAQAQRPNIVWHNKETGANRLWKVTNGQYQSTVPLLSNGGSDFSWKIVGVGDFNNDGIHDLLWQHPTYPYPYIWYLDANNAVTATLPLQSSPGTSDWRIVGAADFDRDGICDILWQVREGHPAANQVGVWYMMGNGTQVREIRHSGASGDLFFPYAADPNWRIVGCANMNEDTIPDILWRHSTRA